MSRGHRSDNVVAAIRLFASGKGGNGFFDEVVAAIKVVDGGEAVSERKRAFGGGQNSTLKKAVSEQRRGKSASY